MFRRTRDELDGNLYVCPRCRGEMVKKIYKHVEDGKAHLLVCPNAECLFLIKFDNILDAPKSQLTVVEVPDMEADGGEVEKQEDAEPTPEPVADEVKGGGILKFDDLKQAKTAKINLQSLIQDVSAKFNADFIDDDILELKNKFGFPKTIYVNSNGSVWSDNPELGASDGGSAADVQKKIREMTASRDDEFKAKELIKLFAHCGCDEQPGLIEDIIQPQGDEITKDVLGEPEIMELQLSPENQDELATMIFQSLLASKEEKLEQFEPHLAGKLASHLNATYENLTFLDLGDGSIKVTFDNKFAQSRPSRQDLVDLLKTASEGVDLSDFYKQIVTDFSKKVSEELPDYFSIRKEVVAEVLEQINEQEK